MSEGLTITTDGGTTFTVRNNVVTITREGQPECSIPLADIKEFADLLEVEPDDDDEGADLE
jgi:hypothetical protein